MGLNKPKIRQNFYKNINLLLHLWTFKFAQKMLTKRGSNVYIILNNIHI